MARFAYTARDAGGRPHQGALDAPSRREALRLLSARGLKPTGVAEEGGPARPGARAARGPGRWSPRERLPFLEGLENLVSGGLSAGEAVRLLAARLHEPRQRRLATALWERLSEGQTLSRALEDFPQVFDGQTVQLVAAGEATGSLREVLQRLIRHFIERRELRQRLVVALAYPVFICLLAGGVILFFLFFLLPRLQTLLGSLGGRLPPSTQLLVVFSEFLLHYGPFLLAGGTAAGLGWWRWRRTPAGRAASDAWLLHAPLAGAFLVRVTILNFSHTLAILLENGITTAEALRLAERTVVNTALRRSLREATDRVLEGETLSASLARTRLFPPLVLDRLAIGEQTGSLAPSLRVIAQNYQADLGAWLQNFTRLVSTAVLLCAFGFVAFLAYAIVSAVFQVSASFHF
jgi:type II secretory pathway component PulF